MYDEKQISLAIEDLLNVIHQHSDTLSGDCKRAMRNEVERLQRNATNAKLTAIRNSVREIY